MNTENLIYLIGFGIIIATSYLWLNQNKYPKIVSFLAKTYNFFNFKKKILEKEFDFNNKSDLLKNYINDPEILENFHNTVCKSIYTRLNPKPTALEINQYFESIFLQEKLLFEGLLNLTTQSAEKNYSKTFYDFVNFQVESISNSIIFNDFNYKNPDLFKNIEGIFINDPSIGIKVLIEEQLELLQKEKVDIVKIYDWLAKNQSIAININPRNTNFKNYYNHLTDYYKTKVELNQNSIILPSLKKENLLKSSPSRLNDILNNGMTEDVLKNKIDQNFEIKNGKYFVKAKKPLEVKKNMFKYFYELFENNNYIPKEPYISKVDRANILSAFFGINIDSTENSRDVTKTDENEFIINYILNINLE